MSTKALLWSASHLYSLAQGVNRGMLRFTRKKADLPVVSIGNLIVGGAGKTPLTLFIAPQFHKVAILTRGYQSAIEDETTWVEGDIPASVCGDEPKMMAQRLPSAKIVVGKHRGRSAALAKELGCRLIILDDGWQQRHVKADISIVVLHKDNLLGGGHYFPFGLLRESPRRLRNADAIFINYIKDEADLETCRQKVARWTDAPLIGMKPRYFAEELQKVRDKQVGLFCALGRPKRFIKSMEAIATVKKKLVKRDHAHFDEKTLRELKKGTDLLVCTEKDFVKLPVAIIEELSIIPMRIDLDITAGAGHCTKLLKNIDRIVREYEAIC